MDGGHKKSPGAIFDVAAVTVRRMAAMDGGHKNRVTALFFPGCL
ncbi:hypothetical protein Q668_11580 [Alcanivorax sp. PN-3]|nr:hypothetical protein Q668_11580 [Alcanivorax sp. PN-3]